MKPEKPPPAFPSEVIFPGVKNPTRERREAEAFLEWGAKPFAGFDPHDPATRRALLDDFHTPFQIAPPDGLAARLAALPAQWDRDVTVDATIHREAEAIGAEIEQWAKLPPGLCVILEGRNAIVTRA